jgi:hypothetical protein
MGKLRLVKETLDCLFYRLKLRFLCLLKFFLHLIENEFEFTTRTNSHQNKENTWIIP